MLADALKIALIILAGHSFTWDGQIFDGIKRLINPDWKISKPIYGCPICMTPWWGTIIWLIFFRVQTIVQDGNIYQTNLGWMDWFLTIATATGISVIGVIMIDIRDYAVSRTRDKDKCC